MMIPLSLARSFLVIPNIPLNARWAQSGVTVSEVQG
ncbi:unnamed protein product, partial [Rotaria sp. Silwood1]